MIEMNKVEEIHKLQRELQEHNYRYHVLDEPIISDYEYDMLLKKLRSLEAAHPEAISSDSPTQRISIVPLERFVKVIHPSPILSLANAFTKEDLKDWNDRITKLDSLVKSSSYVLEPKIDGLTVLIRYENGILVQAATRGDGIQGEDVTSNVKTIKSVPLKIPVLASDVKVPQKLVVRGEIYIKKADFLRLNQKLQENGEKTYQNPRNTASGSLRQLDPKITQERPLSLLSYDIVESSDEMPDTQWHLLEFLKTLGFPVSSLATNVATFQEVVEQVDGWNEKRDSIPFEVDGVVVKLNDLRLAEALGFVGKDPRGAIALKFPAREVSTILEEIRVNVGRTGVLTPYAVLQPVEVGGVVVRQATLHNFDFIAEKDIRPGDRVLIKRAGDVIPYVIGPLIENESSRSGVYVPPDTCPSCGQKIEHFQGEVAWYCVNSACPAQLVRNIEHFVSRGAMDIVGLGEKIVELLVNQKKILDVADLYSLKKEDLEDLEGFGEKKAKNLIDAINESRNQPLARLITGLGIHGIGEVSSVALAKEFRSIDLLRLSNVDTFMKIEGVGPNIAQSIVDWFSQESNLRVIEKLKSLGVWPIYRESSSNSKKEVLNSQIFVITGTLPTLSREQAKKLIEDAGGKVTDSISKNTNYLVVGENAGSKLEKANAFGINIIREEELKKLIGGDLG